MSPPAHRPVTATVTATAFHLNPANNTASVSEAYQRAPVAATVSPQLARSTSVRTRP